MKKKIIIFIAFITIINGAIFAQEKKEDKLKISGYLQGQTEIVGKDGKSKTGGTTSYDDNKDGKDNDYFIRYGLRRGRIKFVYSEKIAKLVYEMDMTENGFKSESAYLEVTPLDFLSLRAGLMTDFFGDEVQYASNKLEVVEMSQVIQKLFPEKKDIGFLLSLNGKKNSYFDGVKLDIGLVSGNAIHKDDDGRMNFMAHLKYNHSNDNIKYGIGASFYRGTTNNIDTLYYQVRDNAWQSDSVEANKKNIRQYVGFDGQISFNVIGGLTNIRAEYVFGSQPSKENDLKSPDGDAYTSKFNHKRNFQGGYLYVIQDVYHTPLTVIAKCAYIDNNTDLKKNDITNPTDLSYMNYGLGMYWTINSNLRITAMYDINKNETTNKISKYSTDVKDNVFTLRLQCKF